MSESFLERRSSLLIYAEWFYDTPGCGAQSYAHLHDAATRIWAPFSEAELSEMLLGDPETSRHWFSALRRLRLLSGGRCFFLRALSDNLTRVPRPNLDEVKHLSGDLRGVMAWVHCPGSDHTSVRGGNNVLT